MPSTAVTTVSVRDLRKMLQATTPPCLLDVREQDEWQRCRIEGATHVPMSEIKLRIGELDPGRETVVYCHHGVRSLKVAEFLGRQGFSKAASLGGGIDAWSVEIDPDVPRY